MLRFYHDITTAADAAVAQVPSDVSIFFIMGVITAVILMAPSYIERSKK